MDPGSRCLRQTSCEGGPKSELAKNQRADQQQTYTMNPFPFALHLILNLF